LTFEPESKLVIIEDYALSECSSIESLCIQSSGFAFSRVAWSSLFC
jgi:hypothetical protein